MPTCCIFAVLFENYVVLLITCSICCEQFDIFVVNNLMYSLYSCVVIINGTFICEFLKLV
jgi:hypothetical protein